MPRSAAPFGVRSAVVTSPSVEPPVFEIGMEFLTVRLFLMWTTLKAHFPKKYVWGGRVTLGTTRL